MKQTRETSSLLSSPSFLVRDDFLKDTVDVLRAAGAICKIHATGHSMYPNLREGDILSVRFESRPLLTVGDVVIIDTGHGLLVHRIIEITERAGMLFCRELGDNTWLAAWHPIDQIAGRVITVTRQNRTISLVSERSHRLQSFIVRMQLLFLRLKDVLPFPGQERALHILRRCLMTILAHG